MNSTRDVRESRIVKSYPNQFAPANDFLQVPTPIVRLEIESNPIPKGADLQRPLSCPSRLIADHFGILSHNGHPHDLELIVEP